MTKEEFINMNIDKELKFMSIMDDVDGIPSFNKIWTCNGVLMLFGDFCLHTVESNDVYPIKSCKVIARPLSDLINPIAHKGETFVPIDKLKELFEDGTEDLLNSSIEAIEYFIENNLFLRMRYLPFILIKRLMKWHFAVGLQDDEYIDINSLEINPYA